ncbi:MAG: response regulator [Acidobacteriota bacterium]
MVLLVDDEAFIRELTTQALKNHGYEVVTANNGAEAVWIYAKNMERIKVVLIDIVIPLLDGPNIIRALKRLNPKIKDYCYQRINNG